jgi:hypothetical protein
VPVNAAEDTGGQKIRSLYSIVLTPSYLLENCEIKEREMPCSGMTGDFLLKALSEQMQLLY